MTIRCGRRCAAAERDALITALDGKRVPPGPAGAPQRGRRDVLPTGRNLFTADPRLLPTPTAMELGRLAADDVIRLYLQTHGEMPRALVIDLWGSATLRTGGEEIAQGLALMGCRPIWDGASGRVTGIEVLPCAAMGRPRVDVTWRISGLFRDLFPAQIALLDAAVRLVAERDEDDEENPLAAAARGNGGDRLARIFGTAPGAYGAGVEELLGAGQRQRRDRRRLSRRHVAWLWRRRGRRHGAAGRVRRAGRHRRSAAARQRRSRRAICWKAPRTRPMSADSRRPRPRSGARPISSCSTPPIRSDRGRGHSTRRSPGSCAAAPSIRATSTA